MLDTCKLVILAGECHTVWKADSVRKLLDAELTKVMPLSFSGNAAPAVSETHCTVVICGTRPEKITIPSIGFEDTLSLYAPARIQLRISFFVF